jgi:hypothetical protein
MQRVWIVQCLCSLKNRHCICASTVVAAYEPAWVTDDIKAEDIPDPVASFDLTLARNMLHKTIRDLLADERLDPFCAICKAGTDHWFYETLPTRFETMAEARPHLEAATRSQRAARQFVTGALFNQEDPPR